jgi:acyl dehydratase
MSIMGFHDLSPGMTLDFGTVTFSEQEIIRFAETYDPMPFHLDRERAAKSPFQALIASGPHPFHVFYVREWAPRFRDSVLAGRGISDWKMHAPVYAGDVLSCSVEIRRHEARPSKGYGIVDWHFRILNQSGVLLQELTMTVLHQLNSP